MLRSTTRPLFSVHAPIAFLKKGVAGTSRHARPAMRDRTTERHDSSPFQPGSRGWWKGVSAESGQGEDARLTLTSCPSVLSRWVSQYSHACMIMRARAGNRLKVELGRVRSWRAVLAIDSHYLHRPCPSSPDALVLRRCIYSDYCILASLAKEIARDMCKNIFFPLLLSAGGDASATETTRTCV